MFYERAFARLVNYYGYLCVDLFVYERTFVTLFILSLLIMNMCILISCCLAYLRTHVRKCVEY